MNTKLRQLLPLSSSCRRIADFGIPSTSRLAWLIVVGYPAIFGGPALANQQTATPPVSAGTTQAAAATKLSTADLEEMFAPIALYPDTLLANTLAACVYEEDLKAATQFMAGGGNVEQMASQDWDQSVKVIAAFPEVIKLLGDNMPWAVAIGQAYLVQGADVMAAVQSLRARAWANGALKTSPQQTVVTQGQVIVIEPADPQIIYVPTYNPSVVYVDHYDSGDVAAAGLIGFGLGITAGLIIANNVDCDWYGGCIGWGHGWGHGGWSHNDVDININGDVNIGNRNTTINNIGNNNNIGNRLGQEGSKWQPNKAKLSPNAASGASLNNYRGIGSGSTVGANAKVPGRTAEAKPIASRGAAPSSKPREGATARPSAPTARPSAPAARPSAPAARPSAPASRPAAPAARPSAPTSRPAAPAARPPQQAPRPAAPAVRPSSSPRPSGFNPGGGGGSRSGSRGGGGGAKRGR